MRLSVMFTAAFLALAGCSPSDEPAKAAEATAAQPAQETQAAEAFVRSLYGPGDRPAEIWSARTAALLAESERLTAEGDMGFFEADPICDCQDGTPVLQSATATSTGPDRADVAVVQGFAEPGNAVHHKTYNLVLENGQWRIDDQHYGQMGEFPYEPMVQRLNAWIAEAKAGA